MPASGERTRLACWRWRPRQRELSQQRVCPGKMVESSLRFSKTELVAARRRDRHARRVRSPEADPAHLISILECIRALEARPRCPLPRLDVLARPAEGKETEQPGWSQRNKPG